MLIRFLLGILAVVFLGLGGATVWAPHLWEHYGILLTTPRATNQFASVVGGAELAIGLLCLYAAVTGRVWFHQLLSLAVILAVISVVRLVSFGLHGGASMFILAEWALEILGAVMCFWLVRKTGRT